MQYDLLQKDLFSSSANGVSPPEPESGISRLDRELRAAAKQREGTQLPAPILESLKRYHAPSTEQLDTEAVAADGAEDFAVDEKSPQAFKTISEVAQLLDVPAHVLRFWESKFPQIKPVKSRGGRRYYRPEDIDVLSRIKALLYQQGYTIKGAKKAFRQPSEPEQSHANAAESALDTALRSLPEKAMLSEKQLQAITVLRAELMGLRDTLKVYL